MPNKKNYNKKLRNDRLKIERDKANNYKMWSEIYLKELHHIRVENEELKNYIKNGIRF